MEIDTTSLPFTSHLVQEDEYLLGPYMGSANLNYKNGPLHLKLEISLDRPEKYKNHSILVFHQQKELVVKFDECQNNKTSAIWEKSVDVQKNKSGYSTSVETNNMYISALDLKAHRFEIWQTSLVLQGTTMFHLRTQKISSGKCTRNNDGNIEITGLIWYPDIKDFLIKKTILPTLNLDIKRRSRAQIDHTKEICDEKIGRIVHWNEALGKGFVLTKQGYAQLSLDDIQNKNTSQFNTYEAGDEIRFEEIKKTVNSKQRITYQICRAVFLKKEGGAARQAAKPYTRK